MAFASIVSLAPRAIARVSVPICTPSAVWYTIVTCALSGSALYRKVTVSGDATPIASTVTVALLGVFSAIT